MKKVAVIGGGLSGLSIAKCLTDRYDVKVFEKESRPGGLIKCDRVNGNLYHIVGGHVFNSKRTDVLDWFWGFFNREAEFTKATRNAIISMGDGLKVGYPIENNIYQFSNDIITSFIQDVVSLAKDNTPEPLNFEEFLRYRFGDTLYNLYFKPYNEKVWRKDLKSVPLSWLEGKLPMPTINEMIFNNITHAQETKMVHSSFYYAKQNGSQFLVDRLAQGLNIVYNSEIVEISKQPVGWRVNNEEFDKVIFCGNIKHLPAAINNIDLGIYQQLVNELEYHGTTSVLCKIDDNPYSWVYMPDQAHQAHRIICTGNFAESNNANELTATVEFTDYISKDDVLANLKLLPFSPEYITHKYTEYTYPIQDSSTRNVVNEIKNILEPHGMYLLGRFAEWEYYNMDAAVGAAIDLNKKFI